MIWNSTGWIDAGCTVFGHPGVSDGYDIARPPERIYSARTEMFFAEEAPCTVIMTSPVIIQNTVPEMCEAVVTLGSRMKQQVWLRVYIEYAQITPPSMDVNVELFGLQNHWTKIVDAELTHILERYEVSLCNYSSCIELVNFSG